MQYNKRILNVLNGAPHASVLEEISGFKDEVVVNVATSPEDAGILCSPENLQSLLSTNIDQLHLDTVDLTSYCKLMQQQTCHLLTKIADLRKNLCNSYCSDLSSEFSDSFSFLQNVCLMLECLALNKNYAMLKPLLLKLRQTQEQLSECSLYLEDTSGCLDILCYELEPCMIQILKNVKKAIP